MTFEQFMKSEIAVQSILSKKRDSKFFFSIKYFIRYQVFVND